MISLISNVPQMDHSCTMEKNNEHTNIEAGEKNQEIVTVFILLLPYLSTLSPKWCPIWMFYCIRIQIYYYHFVC